MSLNLLPLFTNLCFLDATLRRKKLKTNKSSLPVLHSGHKNPLTFWEKSQWIFVARMLFPSGHKIQRIWLFKNSQHHLSLRNLQLELTANFRLWKYPLSVLQSSASIYESIHALGRNVCRWQLNSMDVIL